MASSRGAFDPGKMAAARASKEAQAADAPLTVTQLASRINDALATMPQTIRVVGEVSGLTKTRHWYFDLKDAGAVVKCVAWQSAQRGIGHTPENGQQVVLTGHVSFWHSGGRLSLQCTRIEPVGAGAQDLALRKLVEELRALGWMDEARKRRVPGFPRRVAVITSPTGAAWPDVRVCMQRRNPAVELALVGVRVQGEGSADEVARAIDWVSGRAHELGVDVVLVTRGGGSKEDLAAFNERVVARAIVECRVPVVAAIGHEIDRSVAEMVADAARATPSQAAELLAPSAEDLLQQISDLGERLRLAVRREVDRGDELRGHAVSLRSAASAAMSRRRARLAQLEARLERQRPGTVLERRAGRLAVLGGRLAAAMRARLEAAAVDRRRVAVELRRVTLAAAIRRREDVELLERQLSAVDPASVLQRGYSITRLADGTLVRSVADASAGAGLVTRVADGEVNSTVTGGVAGGSDPAWAPRRGVRRAAGRRGGRAGGGGGARGVGPDQMGLFGGGAGV